jgi:hypothetical protein
MIVEAQVTINGSKEAIWAAITNIEDASETISESTMSRWKIPDICLGIT